MSRKEKFGVCSLLGFRLVLYMLLLTDLYYPTLVLPDRNGKMVNILSGLGPGVEQNLEKIIREHL